MIGSSACSSGFLGSDDEPLVRADSCEILTHRSRMRPTPPAAARVRSVGVPFDRVQRALRHPPGYLARRLVDEARREFDRRTVKAAQGGRGRLAAGNIPGGTLAAQRKTHENLDAMAPWHGALEAVQRDAALRFRIGERAQQARQRRIELFGGDPVDVGRPPSWSIDARSGLDWPRGFHRRIEYVNLDRSSDVKVPWELSRLRHLVALAQGAAVLATPGDVQELERDLDDWIDENPVGWSVNWTCAMEVALRAVNLICVDGILRAARAEFGLRRRLVTCLYQHGWFLVRNLEVSTVNGNHFLADAVGLVWLGRYFAGIGEAGRWYSQGRAMVRNAAAQHVLSDGLDQEGSLRYHALVLEMFLSARVAADQDLADIDPVVSRMLDAMVAITDRHGRLPNIGDDDGGRALALCDAPSLDARRVLALGAVVLAHAGAADRAGDAWPDDAIWLTGGRPAATPTPPRITRWFQDAGIVVLGTGDDHIVVDVGPIGFKGRGGHGHVDAMSFEATLGGQIAVPDSGTATYTGDPALRNELRDAPAHTLVVVDGLPYARIGDRTRLWAIDGDSVPIVRSLDVAEGRHTLVAAQRLPARDGEAELVRCIEWSPGRLTWRDRIVAPMGAEVCQYVQLPGEPQRVDVDVLECAGFRFKFALAGGALDVEPCRRSDRYSSVEPGFRATVRHRSQGTVLEVQCVVTRCSEEVLPG